MREKEGSQREVWGDTTGHSLGQASQGFLSVQDVSRVDFSRRNYTSESSCKTRKERNLSARLQVVRIHLQEPSHLASRVTSSREPRAIQGGRHHLQNLSSWALHFVKTTACHTGTAFHPVIALPSALFVRTSTNLNGALTREKGEGGWNWQNRPVYAQCN